MNEPKLWERKGRGWYVTIGYKQIPLGKDAERARKEYHRILASEGFVKPTVLKVADLVERFLENSERANKPKTVKWHRFFLESFAQRYGKLLVSELKRMHVTHWTQEKRKRPWGQNTVRHAMACVKACLRFGLTEGYLKEIPFTLRLPAAVRRERTLTEADIKILMDHAGRGNFRDVLIALLESGARPSELCMIEARYVDLERGMWILPEHKTKGKTGRVRVIYLSSRLLELSRRLCDQYPEGPLFRNSWGNPWTADNIRLRFKRLKQSHGLDKKAVPYMARSLFVTNALENGVPISTVAHLAGHTDTRMISAHYDFIAQRTQHLRDAVETANKKRG